MKLLVAVDGSEESKNALAYAADISDVTDGAVTAIHVVDPDVYEEGGSEPISGLSDADQRLIIRSVEDAEERGLDILDEAARVAEELGLELTTELLYGDPVREITEYAEEAGFDTIYVGHRGRSERTDLMIGSVAKTVVERATVPVTVVR